jgi:hypothetical protein
MKILNLKEVVVSQKLEGDLITMMSNLPKLNTALQDPELVDLETVRKCIKVELGGKRRPATLSRLLGRFKTLVGQEIDREVYGG